MSDCAIFRNLEDKKEQVIGAIRAQEKLTPALEKQIRDAATLVAVEDLYLPYRPKRRTRAGIAREKGLEPLAVRIYKQGSGRQPGGGGGEVRVGRKGCCRCFRRQ